MTSILLWRKSREELAPGAAQHFQRDPFVERNIEVRRQVSGLSHVTTFGTTQPSPEEGVRPNDRAAVVAGSAWPSPEISVVAC
jgi:hypothetical protein